MKDFVALYQSLKEVTESDEQVNILVDYLDRTPEKESLFAIALLSGRRPGRICSVQELKEWGLEFTQLPEWLYAECKELVGEISETIQLLIPYPSREARKKIPLSGCMECLYDLSTHSAMDKKAEVFKYWRLLEFEERRVFNKILTNTFRLKLNPSCLIHALSLYCKIKPYGVAHCLQKEWSPTASSFTSIFQKSTYGGGLLMPNKFCNFSQLEGTIDKLGNYKDWHAEWQWKGMRCQLLKDNGEITLWSEDKHLVTSKFSKINTVNQCTTDSFIMDGYMIARNYNENYVASSARSKNNWIFCAVDLLYHNSVDIRKKPLIERRTELETIVMEINSIEEDVAIFSDEIKFNSWSHLNKLREQPLAKSIIGVILKKRSSRYINYNSDDWILWPVNPHQISAVLMYVKRSQGFGNTRMNEYTFGVQVSGEEFIPITKINLEFEEDDQIEVGKYIKEHTIERFGPVVSIVPSLIFQISFQGIEKNSRRKSGLIINEILKVERQKDATLKNVSFLSELQILVED